MMTVDTPLAAGHSTSSCYSSCCNHKNELHHSYLYVVTVVIVLACAFCQPPIVSAATASVGADGDTGALPPLGLHFRLENGRFFVTKSSSEDVQEGEALVAVGSDFVSSKPFGKALSTSTDPFVLPVFDYALDGEENGYPLAGFVRVEYFQGTALSLDRPGAGGRHEVSLPTVSMDDVRAALVAKAAEMGSDEEAPAVRGFIESFEAEAEAEEDDPSASFVAVFSVKGPMGVELTPTASGEIAVKAVAPNGAADKAGVMKGDVMMSVNDEPIMKGSTMNQAIQVIGRASWPRSVEFRMSAEHLAVHLAKQRIAERQAQRHADARDAAATAASLRRRAPPPPRHPHRGHTPPPAKKPTKKPKRRSRRRAAAEAAAAAAAQSVPDNEYEALYTSGSLGLEFDATATGLVVSAVVRSGASDKAGVKPGDRVVKVNGDSIEELEFREAVGKIVNAAWPKTLQLRRAEEKQSDEDPEAHGNGVIEMTQPEMAAGVVINVRAALFGRPIASCTRTVRFVTASPPMGCTEQFAVSNYTREDRAEARDDLDALGEDDELNDEEDGAVAVADGTSGDDNELTIAQRRELLSSKAELIYMITLRGGCTFPDKARRAEEADADGVIVVSNTAPVVRMPGDKSHKSQVAAAMVDQKFGMMLAGAAGVGRVEGRFLMEDVEGCAHDGTELLPVLPQAATKLERDAGGRLLVWNGEEEDNFPFVMAVFGPDAEAGTVAPIVRAQPFHGCLLEGGGFDNAAELGHSFAMVERGMCSFSDKVRNLQKLGVAAVIVVNTDDKLMAMPAAPPFKDINTPSVMVSPAILNAPLAAPLPETINPRTGEGPPRKLLGRLVMHAMMDED